MYKLTLTKEERKAIDWIGHRYRHGNELRDILDYSPQTDGAELEWDDGGAATYDLSESDAWTICEIVEEGLDCFDPDLCAKLHDFAEGVV